MKNHFDEIYANLETFNDTRLCTQDRKDALDVCSNVIKEIKKELDLLNTSSNGHSIHDLTLLKPKLQSEVTQVGDPALKTEAEKFFTFLDGYINYTTAIYQLSELTFNQYEALVTPITA